MSCDGVGVFGIVLSLFKVIPLEDMTVSHSIRT